jgi:hypothetical protein
MVNANYISPDDILSIATVSAGDRDYKSLPKGLYMSLIQKAVEGLAIDTFFQELRESFDIPENLVLALPKGCFNVKNVYIFSGDECNIGQSHKVWWKRNYFTKGQGYIANDKGNNANDPFFDSHNENLNYANKNLIRYNESSPNSRLFYNIQMGDLMLSSSCKSAGNKVHVHYNGTGGNIGEEPIIPVFIREAVEDYTIEAALRMRMANEPAQARNWQALWNIYNERLHRPYEGSWAKAEYRVKTLNQSQREEMKEYFGRNSWGKGA